MTFRINLKRDFLPIMNLFLFSIMILLKAYGDAMLANDKPLGTTDDFKYVLLIISTFLSMLQVVKRGKMHNIFVKDFKHFCTLISIWLLISVALSFNAKMPRIDSIKYLLFIIMAFVYAYGMINILNEDMLQTYFKMALVICFACYFIFEKGVALFSESNLVLISFADSASPFESAYAAGTSIAMCAFFSYYRKNNFLWLIVSMLFCFLTFKRASVIMMFIYFFIPLLTDKDKIIHKRTVWLLGGAFTIGTVFMSYLFRYRYIDIVNHYFKIDLNQLFMGRIRLYNTLLQTDYKMAGLGTSLDQMHYLANKTNGIELELVQLLLEVTIIGLIAFIIYCLSLTKRNLYCVAIIIFTLFNMMTSSSLSSPFAWIFTYLTIWSIRKRHVS